MLMSDLKNHVLAEVGSFYLDDLSLLEIQANQFLSIVRNCLLKWRENYFTEGRMTVSPDEYGKVDFRDMLEVGRISQIPVAVTDCFPQSSQNFVDIPTCAYQYDAPILKLMTWINQTVVIDVRYAYRLTKVEAVKTDLNTADSSAWDPNRIPYSNSIPHNVTQTQTADDVLKGFEIVGIENDDNFWLFLNYVSAKFMIALGTSRNSFVINDLPVTLDGTDLISRGETLLQTTEETMHENSDCFLDLLEIPSSGRW
ncbi:hypothetical protein [Vibrio phage Va2]|nr:hypothetical protein [Vibrio phage Va2]